MKKDNIKIVCDVSGIQVQLGRIANELEKINKKIESGKSEDDKPDSAFVEVVDMIIKRIKESTGCPNQD